ncbi:hypothetical protein KB874_17785 [Aestuariicoccus sp. KMU-90]|uniref:Uncharacterized protein n=1 Tax=Thetidibacter halocola TaxID=2827239 RepID=A0A8J8B9V8_9RHOB|nr:hypothetical protein [Thetidibacter halocola]
MAEKQAGLDNAHTCLFHTPSAADLPGKDKGADRASRPVANGMPLRVQTTLGAPDQAAALPSWVCRPHVDRRAKGPFDHHSFVFAAVGSQPDYRPGKESAAALQRPPPLSVLCGPHPCKASLQRKPLRLRKPVPLGILRSSSLGVPWDLGKTAAGRAIRVSLSQKGSDMSPLDSSSGGSRRAPEIDAS